MNIIVTPSLRKLASLKLAIQVCNEPEIKSWIRDYKTHLKASEMLVVNQKISSFILPKVVIEGIESLIKPVMIEIMSWTRYIDYIHREVSDFIDSSCSCVDVINLQESIHWKSVGLIDKYLTSMTLIQDLRLDTAFRFVLACNFCFEADILSLWQLLSSHDSYTFRTENFDFLPVVNYWIIRLKEAKSVNYSFMPHQFPAMYYFEKTVRHERAIAKFYEDLPFGLRGYIFGTHVISSKLASVVGDENLRRTTLGLVNVDNVVAMEYFLRKMERVKGQKLLEAVAGNRHITNDLLIFCLSRMNDSQLTVTLRTLDRSRVLSCFLNSPFQGCFQECLIRIWSTVTATDFSKFLAYTVMFKITAGWQDVDYIVFARILLRTIPREFLSHFCVNHKKAKILLERAFSKRLFKSRKLSV